MRQFPGLPDGAVRLLQQHAEPQHQHRPRPRQPLRRFHGEDREPAAQRVFGKLRLPHQAAGRPVSGHPRNERRPARPPGGPRRTLRQGRQQQDARAAQGRDQFPADGRPPVGEPLQPVHERHDQLQPQARRGRQRREQVHRKRLARNPGGPTPACQARSRARRWCCKQLDPGAHPADRRRRCS